MKKTKSHANPPDEDPKAREATLDSEERRRNDVRRAVLARRAQFIAAALATSGLSCGDDASDDVSGKSDAPRPHTTTPQVCLSPPPPPQPCLSPPTPQLEGDFPMPPMSRPAAPPPTPMDEPPDAGPTDAGSDPADAGTDASTASDARDR